MKKIIVLILISVFSFASEPSFHDEFEAEFKKPKDDFDPLSGYNRAMTHFNDGFFTYVVKPTAKGYKYVVPEVARTGISNFVTNLLFPVRFVNNVLQLKFDRAGKELGRFLINTIWGFGGFMDQATHTLGMEIYKEDFGQTLGYWGVGEGFHIVLPFFGPSNLRDVFGLAGDLSLSPTSQVAHNTIPYKTGDQFHWREDLTINSILLLNELSKNPDFYEIIKKDAIDLYPYLKHAYTQKRNQEIKE